jgi:hypothetical protein
VTPVSLVVSLVYSRGAIPTLGGAFKLNGGLEIVLRLEGVAGRGAGGRVAERPAGFRDFAPADADFRDLCRLAGELDVAHRAPRVRPKVDTSDSWAEILLRIAHENGERTVVLQLSGSGFEGEDAPLLQGFFVLLLRSAGVRDVSAWIDLTGSRPP